MSVDSELREAADPARAVHNATFFKTGKGEYGEGDVFIGLSVPAVRKIVTKYRMLPFGDIERLLHSHIHEFRLCAVLLLVERYRNEPEERERIYQYYLANAPRINNWDLVDASAHVIVGEHLRSRSRAPLAKLARSQNMWERRIAIVATATFIKEHQFADTFTITEMLLADREDLLHKACGWMLREVYKQNPTALESFLRAHVQRMPRTMLRYAIERMPEKKRKAWLAR